VQVEYFIKYFAIDLFFEFDVLGIDVLFIEIKLLTVLCFVLRMVNRSAGTMNIGVVQFGLLLWIVDGEHQILIDGSGDVENIGVVRLLFEFVLVLRQDGL
jgi:hypothetical protein